MSLIFKPKIPTALAFVEHEGTKTKRINAKVPNTSAKPWTIRERNLLVQLRVHNVSFNNCGPLLNRTPKACISLVVAQELYGEIGQQRDQLIKRILA